MVFGTPSIAQLVERRTVECVKRSLGRWFESGAKDVFDHLDLNPNETLREGTLGCLWYVQRSRQFFSSWGF